MAPQWILVPAFIQILLTIFLYVHLARAKARAIKEGTVDRKRAALHAEAWPDKVVQINNNIRNQFETPVLFYVLVFSVMLVDAVHVGTLAAASVFVAARIAHAYIHVSSNYVPLRLRMFLLALVALLAMLGFASFGLATLA